MKLGNVTAERKRVVTAVRDALRWAGIDMDAALLRAQEEANGVAAQALNLRDDANEALDRGEAVLTRQVNQAERAYAGIVRRAQRVFRPIQTKAYVQLEKANIMIDRANEAYRALETLREK